jgi:hypothetical protein
MQPATFSLKNLKEDNICKILHVIVSIILCLLSWLDGNNSTGTTDSHLKRIISTSCFIHTFVTPDDGPRYARNV